MIASVGGSAADFEAYVHGPARAEHDRIIDEAEDLGVFGVPTMVFNGELFWGGDRIDLLIERIREPGVDRGRAGQPAPEVGRIALRFQTIYQLRLCLTGDLPKTNETCSGKKFRSLMTSPADLKKWPSLNNQRVTGKTPYLVYNGTLADCIRQLLAKPVKQISLYDIVTERQAAFDSSVLSPGDAAEIAMRKDFPKADVRPDCRGVRGRAGRPAPRPCSAVTLGDITGICRCKGEAPGPSMVRKPFTFCSVVRNPAPKMKENLTSFPIPCPQKGARHV